MLLYVTRRRVVGLAYIAESQNVNLKLGSAVTKVHYCNNSDAFSHYASFVVVRKPFNQSTLLNNQKTWGTDIGPEVCSNE